MKFPTPSPRQQARPDAHTAESGFSIVFTILLLGFASIIAVSLSKGFVANVRGTRDARSSEQAFYRTEQELEEVLRVLADGETLSSTTCSETTTSSCRTVTSDIASSEPLTITLAAGQEYQLNIWDPVDWKRNPNLTGYDMQFTVHNTAPTGAGNEAIELLVAQWEPTKPEAVLGYDIFHPKALSARPDLSRELVSTIPGSTIAVTKTIDDNRNVLIRLRAIRDATVTITPIGVPSIHTADSFITVKAREKQPNGTFVQRALSVTIPATDVMKTGFGWTLYAEEGMQIDGY